MNDLFDNITLTIGSWDKVRAINPQHRMPYMLDDFVNDHGIEFRQRATDLKRTYPKSRECYFNAYKLWRRRPSFLYCEGYALARTWMIPVMHGWCVDENGVVHDPSVENEAEVAYVGFAYKREWTLEQWRHLRTPRIAGIGILPNLWRLDVAGFDEVRAALHDRFAKRTNGQERTSSVDGVAGGGSSGEPARWQLPT